MCGKNLEVCEGTIILNPENIECGDDVSIGGYNYIPGGKIIFESDFLLVRQRCMGRGKRFYHAWC
jgi:hypothetical protein